MSVILRDLEGITLLILPLSATRLIPQGLCDILVETSAVQEGVRRITSDRHDQQHLIDRATELDAGDDDSELENNNRDVMYCMHS